ncbi:12866_t:CDS:2 [Racocetra fulgida]|uniref:12866_t:CDS:1 n=1 Tax=Racocetra fulgida TaxID=60492 RepID=A0A9N9A919_9GLOM|nr:12866_t:CDS:2 [Racocetra fulgida]
MELLMIQIEKRIEELNNEELKIKDEFIKADEIIISQLETSQQHPDEIISLQSETSQRDPNAIYTSQFIYFFP